MKTNTKFNVARMARLDAFHFLTDGHIGMNGSVYRAVKDAVRQGLRAYPVSVVRNRKERAAFVADYAVGVIMADKL